jgi:hypothetical protein
MQELSSARRTARVVGMLILAPCPKFFLHTNTHTPSFLKPRNSTSRSSTLSKLIG